MPGHRLTIGGECKNGHIIEGENLVWRKDRGAKRLTCLACERARDLRMREKIKASADLTAARKVQKKRTREARKPDRREFYAQNQRDARLLQAVVAAEEKEPDISLKDDSKRTAPWNYLAPTGKIDDVLAEMNKALETERSNCHNRPEDFMDFDDPRFPEDWDQDNLKPIPPNQVFEALCSGCPVRDLCGKVAATGDRNTLDFGARDGKFYVGAKIYVGSTSKTDKKEE